MEVGPLSSYDTSVPEIAFWITQYRNHKSVFSSGICNRTATVRRQLKEAMITNQDLGVMVTKHEHYLSQQ